MFDGLISLLRKASVVIGTAYLVMEIAIVLVLCISLFFLGTMLRQYFQYRKPQSIRCPETNEAVLVQVNAWNAALTSVVNNPVLRVSACSRWPERQNCDRACLRGIEAV